MLGLMQDTPLTVNMIFRRAATYWRARTVATATAAGIDRTTIGALTDEVRVLAGALDALGLDDDARIGSFAWNTARHLQLYLAVPGTGRVLHTINIRYTADQIAYTVDHAEDQAIFVDRSLLPALAPLLGRLSTVRHIVVMDDGGAAELPPDPRVVAWTDLMRSAQPVEFDERVVDENRAAALCYTTGTTGNPKGVLYSHRSTWLHANAGLNAGASRVSDHDNVMPVVPMFHAMAWGLPYTALMAGASLTMPGPDLSPAALLSLIESERVTYSAGVPTIWMGMLPLLDGRDVSSLDRVMAGGSAVPRALSEAWRAKVGFALTQGWGMTESSPVGAIGSLRAEFDTATDDERAEVHATAGLGLVGIEMRIVDTATDEVLPWDDLAVGELQTRGPWVAKRYFRTDEPGPQFSDDGWLRTGDVAAISPLGYVRLVDRTKDLIKSGGEWISSIDLENAIMAHPGVAEAAVIAVPHPRWMERPLACVVPRPGTALAKADILDYLGERLPRWLLPDDVVFLAEIPKTSVGKFSKKTLRELYADHQSPEAS